MGDLAEEIRDAYLEAGKCEHLARTHPDHCDEALRAADLFDRTAALSEQMETAEDYPEENRAIASALTLYYKAQAFKSRGWHAYERRDCAEALRALAEERYYFQHAVRRAGELVQELSPDGVEFLAPQLESWKVSLELIPSYEYACQARDAWDHGRTVEALDWYRHTVSESERILALDAKIPPHINPSSRRIMRGNIHMEIANASQALARILLEQAQREGRSLYDFARDEGLQFLGHFLDVHAAGSAAMGENPEWEQSALALKCCRENIEQFLRDTVSHWKLIYTRYHDSRTLSMIMQQLNPEAFAMAKDDQVLRDNKIARLWGVGSFWLLAALAIVGAITIMASIVSPWVVFTAVCGIEAVYILVMAATLRSMDDLSQANFLRLVALAFRFQFLALRKLDDPGQGKNETEKHDGGNN